MTINFTPGLVIGIELLAVAALLFIFGRAISRRWPRHAWLVSFGRIALAIVGLGLASATLFDTTPESRTPNPVPFTVTPTITSRSYLLSPGVATSGLPARPVACVCRHREVAHARFRFDPRECGPAP